jgi:DNA repair protein RadC
MSIKMKDIPVKERPRERLIKEGVEKLSNEELLSILIGNGTKGVSAKDLSLKVLDKIKSIGNANLLNYRSLLEIKGLGVAKACSLLAAFELGKRVNIENNSLNSEVINNSGAVFNYFKNIFLNKKQEYFYCLYLDSKKHVISNKLLFMGTLNRSIVHPREVFKEAYLLSASSIICVHNHPSGNVEPSKDDIDITNQLSSIGYIMGIKLVDHLIIGSNTYYSFLENGKII